jgi:hypothetical protein
LMKKAHTTYAYSCDLCGQEMPNEGIKLPGPRGTTMDLCEKCPERPIRDILAHIEKDQAAIRRR